MPYHEIVIVVDKTARSIVLKHNGKEYLLQSLALFGGGAKNSEDVLADKQVSQEI